MGELHELNEREVEGLIRFRRNPVGIFFYTPLCGTCKLAARMLHIAVEALPEVDVFQCNVNHAGQVASYLKIESIPCLLLMNGEHYEKIYAMESVANLYEQLQLIVPS